MKALLIMLVATSCMADAGRDLQEQINHDQILTQLKESNRIAREQLDQTDTGKSPDININVPGPQLDPCSYALIKKGDGYETFTFKNGRTVNVYVRVCDGRAQ